MIDKKLRSNPTIGPLDIGSTYVDSVFNAGTVSIDKLISDASRSDSPLPLLDKPLFQAGTSGAQTRPNEGGFAYSDTPECSIFLQKREWVEDDWTYVTNSAGRPGKVEELLTRIRIGNIITRKLDWLNDHELFTKFSDLTSSLTSEFASQINGNSATTLSGSQVTKYYTENLSLEEQPTITKRSEVNIDIAASVEINTQESGQAGRLLIRTDPNYNAPIITSLQGPNTGGPSSIIVKTTGIGDVNKPDNVIPGENNIDPVQGILSDLPEEIPEDERDRYQSAQFWKIDLTALSAYQLYPEANRDLAMRDYTGEDNLKSQQDYAHQRIKDGGINKGVGYIARIPKGRTPPHQIALPKRTTSLPVGITQEELGEKTSQQFENVFNGVVELANVGSINTNIRNDGSIGQASFTVENPNNILTISNEDIDIALGENPFLQPEKDEQGQIKQNITTTDPETGETLTFRYYRGRYYRDSIYNLVTNQDTSALTFATPLLAQLKQAEIQLNEALDSVQQFLSGVNNEVIRDSLQTVYSFSFDVDEATAGGFEVNTTVDPFVGSITQTQLQQARLRRREISNVIVNIRARIDREISGQSDQIKDSSKEERHKRLQLKKYFQNRTIFQVYDRIFIWMTSPSRTVRTLNDGTVVSEDFTQGEVITRRVQDIIALMRQLENLIQTISSQTDQPIRPIFTASNLATINSELFSTGTSEKWEQLKESVEEVFQPADSNIVSTIIQSATEYVEDATNSIADFLDTSFSGGAREEVPKLVETLTETISKKIEELQEIKATAKDDPSNDPLPGANSDTIVRGIDPSRLFSDDTLKFAGAVDQQFQVFQGVITSVSRSYSNGAYQIQINCQDNLDFLSRSRYITIPGLTQYANRARPVLDDPIWRRKDAFITDSIPLSAKPDDIVGRWKSGILTLTAKIQPDKDSKNTSSDLSTGNASAVDTTNSFKEETINRAFGRTPQAENEPFEGADPAQIISVLTTGVPFDIPTYIDNTNFKGTLNATPILDSTPEVSHDGEIIQVGPFEAVRRQIADQVKKYGSFQPFLQVSGSQPTEAEKIDANDRTQVNIATTILLFFKLFISRRQNLEGFTNAVQQDAQKTKDSSSAYSVVTPDNMEEIIEVVSNPDNFPTERDQINLSDDFKNVAPSVVQFIITAALRGTDPNRVNTLMTEAFNQEAFDSIAEGFANSFENFNNRPQLAMTAEERSSFQAISEAVQSRINRGATLDALSNTGKTITAEDFPLPEQVDRKTVFDVLKPQRDATLHPSILQATRSSIIFKQKPNFLVVSDQYLLSPGLVDYVRQIGNPGGSFQDNQYGNVLDRCVKAAKTIDWEFYADTQGHLRFKAPTYNRVFLKHLLDVRNVEPTYRNVLLSILKDFKADGAIKALFYIEYRSLFKSIRAEATEFVKDVLSQIISTPLFVEDTSFSLSSILGVGAPQPNSLFALVQEDITSAEIANIRQFLLAPLDSVINLEATIYPQHPPVLDQLESSIKADLRNEVEGIFNQLFNNQNGDGSPIERPVFEQANVLSPTLGAIKSSLTREIQQYRNTLSPNADNLEQANDALSISAQAVLYAGLRSAIIAQDAVNTIDSVLSGLATEQRGDSLIPELDSALKAFTDEQFIHNIPSSIIINENYREDPPEFTRLNVQSSFAFAGENQDDIANQFLHWAGSVDYDLWRMYGYKVSGNIQVPFLQSGQQAAVYADLLMARQYATILKGSITVRGDSKYQLGDCVFIEDENLYYYVTGIQHQFTYGSSYQTVLTLEYGRRPGYYIPYPFDVLGRSFTRGVNSLYSKGSAQNLTEILEAFEEESRQLQNDPGINN